MLYVVIGVAVAVLGLVALVAARPSTFRVTREGVVGGSPSETFEMLSTFSRWPEWSPWEDKDPDMKRSYDGPSTGVGSSYAWDGDGNVGAGRMTILDLVPDERLDVKLEFFRPFAGTNQVQFRLTPAADGTKVVWVMDGTYNFISKAFSMVMDMDKMIGADFEKGLKNLDRVLRGVRA